VRVFTILNIKITGRKFKKSKFIRVDLYYYCKFNNQIAFIQPHRRSILVGLAAAAAAATEVAAGAAAAGAAREEVAEVAAFGVVACHSSTRKNHCGTLWYGCSNSTHRTMGALREGLH
jgi:hypothetical protein